MPQWCGREQIDWDLQILAGGGHPLTSSYTTPIADGCQIGTAEHTNKGGYQKGVAEWDGKATGKRGGKTAEEVRAALGWKSRRLIPPDRSTPAKARPARVSSHA